MNTYTLVYRSTPRNLPLSEQAALMVDLAPLAAALAVWTVAGLDFVSDSPSVVSPQALRTVVLHDSATPGIIPPGQPMAQFLTNFLTGTIASGIVAPVKADPVAVT